MDEFVWVLGLGSTLDGAQKADWMIAPHVLSSGSLRNARFDMKIEVVAEKFNDLETLSDLALSLLCFF